MTRLAIVQLLPALDVGGVERGTLEIARAIVAAGHRSIVVSDRGRLVERLIRDGSEHIEWRIGAKSPLTLRFVAKLDALVRARGIDVIHARSRVIALAIDARQQHYPHERRYVYQPLAGELEENRWCEAARESILKNYDTNTMFL